MMTISSLKGYLFEIYWLEIQKMGVVCNCHCLKKKLTLTLAIRFLMTISNLKGYLFKIYWLEIQKSALFAIVIVCRKKANSYTGNLFYDDIFQSESLPF